MSDGGGEPGGPERRTERREVRRHPGRGRAVIMAWLSQHRSLVTTAVSSMAVLALVAGVAVASGGYTAQRMDLGDAGIWVTNGQRQVVGRANTEVLELNTVVDSSGSNLEVVQQGGTVLVLDRGNNSVDIVDPATSELTESVPLPPVDPGVALAGSNVIVQSDGNVWSVPVDELPDFDSESTPQLALGSGSIMSVDASGVIFSFTPSTGDLVQADGASGEVVTTRLVEGVEQDDVVQLTSTAGRWALLDVTTRTVIFEDRVVDLAPFLGVTDTPQLQQASVSAGGVYLAHHGGLLFVPDGGEPLELVTGRSGDPAAPVVAEGCVHAAWADSTVWQRCGDDRDGTISTIDGIGPSARLVFRTNGRTVVLNDARGGASWAVQRDNQLIDNWDDLIVRDHDEQRVEENDQETPPEFEKTQVPPVAVDDSFGARPGKTTTLPVLFNDFDPNGDVLVISEISPPAVELGRIDLVSNRQQLQLTLPPEASGTLSFGYTISDGRGGVASAVVTVTVRSDEENSPPQQLRTTKATVQSGGRVTTQVLGDWIDPDGDPFFLVSATAPAPDGIGFKPDGTVIFTDAGGDGESRQLGLVVSDGRDEATGSLLVTVKPSGAVPIVAESFAQRTYAGQEITVSPLGHVRGGSGDIRLSSVPAKPDVTITPDFDGGTFRFVSDAVRTHYIEYAVTDGQQTATGLVRIDVDPIPNGPTRPITVPHTAFVRAQGSAAVDVLATDIDPTGGVLLVTGVRDVPPASGMRVEILEQRLLRITLTRPLENGSSTFGYRVSNGLAEADGSVTVIEVPAPARKQAPVATADSVSVRVGDVIDIPVLDNDEHPDGDPLTLNPTLPTALPADAGLLFSSGSVLRYLAPKEPGNYTAVYQVDAPDGQYASAEVRISVREADAASNTPPVPKTVTARVLSGDTVRIRVPLTGIDPDGDSVQLLGQETNPEKGAVVGVGPDWIEYEAGEYSAGTDSFGYSVIDALGARATGTVRVGISSRLDGAHNPVAVEDEIAMRPGSTVSVRVLGNDSDPDGGSLSITGVEATTEGASAKVVDDTVRVTAPAAEGRYGFIYEIQNERGGTSSNFLTVIVRKDAPLSRPDARDTVLALSEVLGRETVDVDVLAKVFFADGSPKQLGLSLLPDYERNATVTGNKRIRVTVGDASQIIPFAVSHPEDPTIVSYAFIWVPGFDDALPQLRRNMPKLTVASEDTLTIHINDYVVAVGGKDVRLTDAGTVRSTHSDGSDLVVDDKTVRFTSADKYYGPASISFEVTDGSSADDPNGRTATIVLPITVTPRENQPPVFVGGVIDFEPDQSKTIELLKLTNYPYPDDQRELVFSVLEPKPDAFDYRLDGQQLTLHATERASKGSQSSIILGVGDAVNQGQAGRIELRVVPSTRPLAVPASDSQIVPRGRTTVIDVLDNDTATNPFPKVPLRVVGVRGIDGGIPAGVSIVPSEDRSRLTVTVAPTAAPVDTNLQYQVADATNDPDRFAWGTVRISVQDRPDPVTNLRVTGYGDRALTIAFDAAAFNNSAISGYDVALLDPASGAVVGSTACRATTCEVATPGNGEANRVRVQVTARNAIGASDPATTSEVAWSDVVPPAPTGVSSAPLDGGLRMSWNPVVTPGGGTPVSHYVVTVGGEPLGELSASSICTASRCSVDRMGLANGSTMQFSVSARNQAYPALSSWQQTQGSGIPFGAAVERGITVASDRDSGTMTVSWGPFDANGDPNGIGGYFVQQLVDNNDEVPTGAQACTVSQPAPGTVTAPVNGGNVKETHSVGAGTTSMTFTGLIAENTRYNFVVWGYNAAGCAHTVVAGDELRPGPGGITGVSTFMAAYSDYLWDLRINDVNSRYRGHYKIQAVDGSGTAIGPVVEFGGTGWAHDLLGRPWGEAVRFKLQACSPWNTCGAWSGVYPASPQPSLTFELPSRQWGEAAHQWTWTNAPDNTAAYPATFRCGTGQNTAGAAADTPNSCTLPTAPGAGQSVWLEVEVAGQSRRYVQTR
ncbi:Ig-like domain-containing protein [Luethyella okanaganae]|uniref:Ig-like domain-containing protein n=1 Tax=Luethyella okanaganae TaxID=69372 RepID=A0ABW1VJA4_9MICO